MLKHLQHLARRSALLIACGSILFNTSCQQKEEELPAPIAAEASAADIRLAAPDQATVTAVQTWFRQASGESSVRVNWAQALTSDSWLVAPFTDQKNPFASGRKQGYRYLVAQKLTNGTYTGHIIEIALDGLANAPERANQLMLYAVQRYKNAPRSILGFSGWIVIYSPAYVRQTSLAYQDGLLQPQTIWVQTPSSSQTQNKTGQTANLTASGELPTANLIATCISVTTCGTVNGYDAGCATIRYCVEGDNPDNPGDGPGWGGGGGGGGGSGDGSNSNPAIDYVPAEVIQTTPSLGNYGSTLRVMDGLGQVVEARVEINTPTKDLQKISVVVAGVVWLTKLTQNGDGTLTRYDASTDTYYFQVSITKTYGDTFSNTRTLYGQISPSRGMGMIYFP